MIKPPIFVTFDTNILDAAQYNFKDKSLLQILSDYVKEGKVKVVLSNVVVQEAETHIADKWKGTYSALKKIRDDSLKCATEEQISQIGLSHFLKINANEEDVAKNSIELLHKYFEDMNVEILSSSSIDLDSILDDYFAIRAPFQDGTKKRKEFPDAFAAYQIRKRFGHNKKVAIISNDDGFKEACQAWDNHIFFSSLNAFFDEMNKSENLYNSTIEFIQEHKLEIENELSKYIENEAEIEVIGLSYDRNGVCEGYDYSDTSLEGLSDVSIYVHSVDSLSETSSVVTLGVGANFDMNCYYDDYPNAPWDSEEKKYVYVDTLKFKEKHHANFACRIDINKDMDSFEIIPFKIRLGGDSRKSRQRL